MIRALALILGLLPGLAQAEPYPAYLSTDVNDFAGLLSPEAAARLQSDLQGLHDDTGIEMAVVTLPSRQGFEASANIEEFALRLFNGWGIGDASRNDGILVLVLKDDREMRIQLGSAYHQGYDVLAISCPIFATTTIRPASCKARRL